MDIEFGKKKTQNGRNDSENKKKEKQYLKKDIKRDKCILCSVENKIPEKRNNK